MKKPKEARNSRHVKARAKIQTNKILDRITFNPQKHKQKKTRELRQQLQQKSAPDPKLSSPKTALKFGSFNINGLDLETSWAVGELVKKHGFDVRYKNVLNFSFKLLFLRYWL